MLGLPRPVAERVVAHRAVVADSGLKAAPGRGGANFYPAGLVVVEVGVQALLLNTPNYRPGLTGGAPAAVHARRGGSGCSREKSI